MTHTTEAQAATTALIVRTFRVAQTIFSQHREANDIDVSPLVNAGHGFIIKATVAALVSLPHVDEEFAYEIIEAAYDNEDDLATAALKVASQDRARNVPDAELLNDDMVTEGELRQMRADWNLAVERIALFSSIAEEMKA